MAIADTEMTESESKIISSDWENEPRLNIKFHGEKQFHRKKFIFQKQVAQKEERIWDYVRAHMKKK